MFFGLAYLSSCVMLCFVLGHIVMQSELIIIGLSLALSCILATVLQVQGDLVPVVRILFLAGSCAMSGFSGIALRYAKGRSQRILSLFMLLVSLLVVLWPSLVLLFPNALPNPNNFFAEF